MSAFSRQESLRCWPRLVQHTEWNGMELNNVSDHPVYFSYRIEHLLTMSIPTMRYNSSLLFFSADTKGLKRNLCWLKVEVEERKAMFVDVS